MVFCGNHALDYYGHDFADGSYVEWVATFKLTSADGESASDDAPAVSDMRYYGTDGVRIVTLNAATQAKVDTAMAETMKIDEDDAYAQIGRYLDEKWEAARDEAYGA